LAKRLSFTPMGIHQQPDGESSVEINSSRKFNFNLKTDIGCGKKMPRTYVVTGNL
jgi:hypothetical protein